MLLLNIKVLWAKKEMFQHTFIILFREFLDVLAFPWLLSQAQHPLLTLFVFLLPGLDAIHPVQQNSSSNAKNTPIVTCTLLCKQLKSWTKWSTFGTCGCLLISDTSPWFFFYTQVILHYPGASSIMINSNYAKYFKSTYTLYQSHSEHSKLWNRNPLFSQVLHYLFRYCLPHIVVVKVRWKEVCAWELFCK